MTTEHDFLDNLAISTEASVWPALTRTPPSLEIIGKTCPGETISFFFILDLEIIYVLHYVKKLFLGFKYIN